MVKNLSLLRIQTGKNQKKVASDLGINYTTYHSWESGVSDPGIENLIKLADYFNVSLDFLLGRNTRDGIGTVTAEEYAFIKKYLSLNSVSQDKLSGYIDALIDKK